MQNLPGGDDSIQYHLWHRDDQKGIAAAALGYNWVWSYATFVIS